MVKKPYVLWLIWQNQETRQRYHVGNLFHEDGKYTFSYELSGRRRTLFEAMENGYQPHLSFRNIEKSYVSNRLFGPFARRLPDKRRPDFKEILKDFALPLDYTEMDLLRATGGRLATDPYEFVAPISVLGDHFHFDFFVAGWRYYEGDKIENQLQAESHVTFELEPLNDEDNKAVIVLSGKKGYKLGYIPAFYSGFMFDVIRNKDIYEAKIEKINPYAKPQLKVNISIVGRLKKGYYTTSHEDVEPVQYV
ncbi:DNA-binding protein [Terrilactibacillus sp. BCM23-1]|uniref:DNA-binding protein n=1 Tax=Terrilactibacillus tamarindi TaxID=2599694 RepID=A0A6N8CVD2_9BACI|nr:HIRAN domain-containing protein [Terrilactibacillus tamarindi]MTT32226.1 DNA-binding protein [Terrilactibacillus tamarindi]